MINKECIFYSLEEPPQSPKSTQQIYWYTNNCSINSKGENKEQMTREWMGQIETKQQSWLNVSVIK